MLEIIVTALAAGSNLLLGLFTYLKNPKSATNRLFAILTLIIAGWATTNYFSLHSPTPEQTLFWIRAVMVITSPMGPVIFLLVNTFPKFKIGLKKKFLYPIVAFATILSIVSVTTLMFSGVSIVDGNIAPTPGPAIIFFAFSFQIVPILSFIALFFKMRRAQGLEKVQLRYFFLGALLTFSLMGITNFFFVIVLKSSALVVFGPLFSLILIGFISYAIVVHRFLDFNLLVARSAAYVLTLLSIVAAYVIAGYVFFAAINQAFELQQMILSAVLGIALLVTFQPVKNIFEKITSRIFYHDSYSPQEFLQSSGRIVASNLMFSDLINSFGDQLVAALKPSWMAVLVFDKETHGMFDQVKYKISDEKDIEQLMRFSKVVFQSGPQTIIFEETDDEHIKEVLRSYNISVMMPMVVNNELIGALLVGQRVSGDIYGSNDIDVLKIITPQLAIGVQNALSYEKIRQFNIALSDEIAKTKQFQQAVESATDGIFMVNPKQQFLFVNNAWEKLTGYPSDEVLKQKLDILFKGTSESKEFEQIWKQLEKGQNFSSDNILISKHDATEFHAQLSIYPIKEKEKILFYVGSMQDITRRFEADRMRSEFITIASHQLNTPLSAMKWFIQMLQEGKAGALSKKQLELVQEVADSNIRMVSLVKSLLNVSRIESGRIMINPVPTDIDELVQEVLADVKPSIKLKQQKITVDIPARLPKVKLDPRLISHALMNLLSNANKYSPEKSKISIEVKKKDDFVVFHIKDTGLGIPEADQAKVFDKFFRAENVRKLEADGNGLGLYLVKSVIESSGGTIHFASKLGEGTEFVFTLPIKGVPAKRGEVSLDALQE